MRAVGINFGQGLPVGVAGRRGGADAAQFALGHRLPAFPPDPRHQRALDIERYHRQTVLTDEMQQRSVERRIEAEDKAVDKPTARRRSFAE